MDQCCLPLCLCLPDSSTLNGFFRGAKYSGKSVKKELGCAGIVWRHCYDWQTKQWLYTKPLYLQQQFDRILIT